MFSKTMNFFDSITELVCLGDLKNPGQFSYSRYSSPAQKKVGGSEPFFFVFEQ